MPIQSSFDPSVTAAVPPLSTSSPIPLALLEFEFVVSSFVDVSVSVRGSIGFDVAGVVVSTKVI